VVLDMLVSKPLCHLQVTGDEEVRIRDFVSDSSLRAAISSNR
jgi:hypothetical protein